jgi:hypothetical protein
LSDVAKGGDGAKSEKVQKTAKINRRPIQISRKRAQGTQRKSLTPSVIWPIFKARTTSISESIRKEWATQKIGQMTDGGMPSTYDSMH